jgi:hypothetical protein
LEASYNISEEPNCFLIQDRSMKRRQVPPKGQKFIPKERAAKF